MYLLFLVYQYIVEIRNSQSAKEAEEACRDPNHQWTKLTWNNSLGDGMVKIMMENRSRPKEIYGLKLGEWENACEQTSSSGLKYIVLNPTDHKTAKSGE